MEIKKVINAKKENGYVVCSSAPEVSLVMGSMAVAGNYHHYGVEKRNNKFYIPIKVIEERISILEMRVGKILESLSVMRQVLK
jgi:hypothetical protein